MHIIPSNKNKIKKKSGSVYSVTTQELFSQSLNVLCHSLARRGQPCIMSALTAVQLYMIQSLDEIKLKPSRATKSLSTFNTYQIKLWTIRVLVDPRASTAQTQQYRVKSDFEGARVASVWSGLLSPALSFILRQALYLFGATLCAKCDRHPIVDPDAELMADNGYFSNTYTHSCWFGSFISHPGAPLLIRVCWF